MKDEIEVAIHEAVSSCLMDARRLAGNLYPVKQIRVCVVEPRNSNPAYVSAHAKLVVRAHGQADIGSPIKSDKVLMAEIAE